MQKPQDAIKVFEQRTFLVCIKIGRPCGNLTIDRKDQRAETIRAYNGKSRDSIPIYEVVDGDGKVIVSAQKAATRLSSILDSLQDRYMLASGEKGDWYVAEAQISELDRAIKEELETERDRLLEELIADDIYQDARDRYSSACKEALELDEVGEALLKFPSKEEIICNFRVEIRKWEALPSLEEIQGKAATDAALKRQVEVVERTIKNLHEEAPKIQQEIWERCANILFIAEGFESGKPIKKADQVRKYLDRLEVLQNLWISMFKTASPELSDLTEKVRAIWSLASNPDTDESRFDNAINFLRQHVRSLTFPAGDGAALLTKWAFPERNLEAQLTELEAQLAKLEPESDEAVRIVEKIKTVKVQIRLKMERLSEKIGTPDISTPTPPPVEAATLATTEQLSKLTLNALQSLAKNNGMILNYAKMTKRKLAEALTGFVELSQVEALQQPEKPSDVEKAGF